MRDKSGKFVPMEGKKRYSAKRKATFSGPVPACCDAERYGLWKLAARNSKPDPSAGFCTDCTPTYQAKMKKQKRCENTDIYFIVDVDGWITGRMSQSREATAIARRAGRIVENSS